MKPARGRGKVPASRPARRLEENGEEGEKNEAAQDSNRMRERVIAAAFRMLARRARSESQLRERLLMKPWVDPEAVEHCIGRLKEMGYVDDGAFARTYASSRVSGKAVGRARIARELARTAVSQETIDQALNSVFDEVSEEALVDRAIAKRIRTHGQPSDVASARRMFAHLARLGFEYSLIVSKLRSLKTSASDNEE